MQPDWRIYYADGSTFDSTEGSIYDAPPWKVALIVQRDLDAGREIISGLDYFWYRLDEEKWCGGDLIGTVEQFAHYPLQRAALKVGHTMTKKRWKELREIALVDPDFPRATRPVSKLHLTSGARRGQWCGEQGDD